MLSQKRSLLWVVGLLFLVLSGLLERFGGQVGGSELLSGGLLAASVVVSGAASLLGGTYGEGR